jgi:uncharacterized protein (TIGR00730 family)
MKRICIFCGSSSGARADYREAAERMGEAIARRGLSLVYGGGQVGLMGAVADSALRAGGDVIGVIPEALALKEIAHTGLSKLHVVDSMHARKAMMADLSDAFVAMPGGFGTFEEFCEIITWAQLGIHQKPTGLLNTARYYDPLIAMFDRARDERFVRSEHRSLVLEAPDPDFLLDKLAAWRPDELELVEKWIRKEQS